MCMCMYDVRLYLCMYVYVCSVCMYVSVMCIHTLTCMYVYMHAYTCACICMCMWKAGVRDGKGKVDIFVPSGLRTRLNLH